MKSGAGPVARHDDTVEGAFAAAVAEPGRVDGIDGLLDALRLGRLWLPLPGEGRPVTEGGGVRLPTLRYLGAVFVPAYTSAARLRSVAGSGELAWAGAAPEAGDVPHIVVRAADLAGLLPPGIGIALNPGCAQSVPVFPAGVAEIAAGTLTGALAALPAPRRPSA